MIKINWKLENKKVSNLKEFVKNPRRLTEKGLKDLESSIKKFGIAEPIVVNADNMIVGGHGRKKVLEKLKIEQVDCYVPNRLLDEKEVDELCIRLNKNIAGEFDFDILANEFEMDDLLEWGFEEFELGGVDEEEPEIEEDEVPELKKDSIVKRGDVWILGKHRLKCGDSTLIDDVEDLMGGEKVDMVFTDPPYGMCLSTENSKRVAPKGGWSNKPKEYKEVIGDHDDFTPELINTVFASFSYCKEIFLWGADYYAELIPDRNKGSWISWDKRTSVEDVNYTGSHFELCWSKSKHNRDIARIPWFGLIGVEKEHDKKRVHPTQKPCALVKWFFDKWGKDKNLIADLFLGSGSTLIACEQTNRKCYGMELDEHYCTVIIFRWLNLMIKQGKESEIVLKCNNEEVDYKTMAKMFTC